MSNKRKRDEDIDHSDLLNASEERLKNIRRQLHNCISFTENINCLQNKVLDTPQVEDNIFNKNIMESRKQITGILEDINHKYVINELTYILENLD